VTRAALSLLLVGCAASHGRVPDCVVGGPMGEVECAASLDALSEAYDYAGLRPCLSHVALYRAADVDEMREVCSIPDSDPAPHEVLGCYYHWPEYEPTWFVVIRADVEGPLFRAAWEHELRHRAAHCALGDEDLAHQSEFFR
jgi:hypothetical protein